MIFFKTQKTLFKNLEKHQTRWGLWILDDISWGSDTKSKMSPPQQHPTLQKTMPLKRLVKKTNGTVFGIMRHVDVVGIQRVNSKAKVPGRYWVIVVFLNCPLVVLVVNLEADRSTLTPDWPQSVFLFNHTNTADKLLLLSREAVAGKAPLSAAQGGALVAARFGH